MRYKRKLRRGEYQSKAKRRKRPLKDSKSKVDDISTITASEGRNDDQSTLEYSNGVGHELLKVLDTLSEIGTEMLEKTSSELSNCIPIDAMQIRAASDDGESNIGNMAIEDSRESVLMKIKHVIGEENNLIDNAGLENKENCEEPIDDAHDLDTCACHVPRDLQYAVDSIESKTMLIPLIKRLNKAGILDDFLKLLEFVGKGKIEANNVPLVLAADLAKVHSCESTTGMRFRPETIDFWNVYYRTCHASGLQLASGSKHSGHVASKLAEKGKYDPSTGSFNFIVPHPKTIRKHQKRVDKFLYAGILDCTFPLLDRMQQYVLEYDGKRISSGLGQYGIGDVNLWGYENPSLKKCKEDLEEEINIIDRLSSLQEKYDESLIPLLQKLIYNISKRIKKKRLSMLGHLKYLREVTKMCENNVRLQKKYNKTIQDTKGNIILLKNWIGDALQLNRSICCLLADVNQTSDLLCLGSTLKLNNQNNYKRLFHPDELKDKVNLDRNPHIVKQRTDKWFELRKKARLTGSTMYRSLGLDTLKRQREHYDEFILGNKPKPFPKEVQNRLDHGTKNEINGIGTLAGLFMPAFLPACSILFEDGANFIHGSTIDNMMEVSTDGYVKCCKNNNCDVSQLLNIIHRNYIVEVKCRYPEKGKLQVYYELPERYVPQILAGMRCKKVSSCIFISYSKESTVFLRCEFDEELWGKLWSSSKESYDHTDVEKPTCLKDNVTELKKDIKEYTECKVQMICELPSQETVCEDVSEKVKSPYYSISGRRKFAFDKNQFVDDTCNVCSTANSLTNQSFQLCRKKAGEILGFTLGSCNREQSEDDVFSSHVPIAYAMKGYSLNTTTMRHMIEEVRDKCKEEQVEIVCEVSDGQWWKIAFSDIHGNPLTRIQFQKKIWNETMKMKKEQMISFLLDCCKMEQDEMELLAAEQSVCILPGRKKFDNITVECEWKNNCRKIFVETNGGLNKIPNLMAKITTTPKKIHSGIWKSASKGVQEELTREQILELLPQDIVNDDNVDPISQKNDDNDNITDNESLSDISQASNKESNILRTILNELIILGKKKCWKHMTPRALFKYHLCDAEAIASSFVVAELDTINNVFRKRTGKNIFKKSENKGYKVNKVSEKFGDKSIWEQNKASKDVRTLKDLAFKVVSSGALPKQVIACSVARIQLYIKKDKWLQSATIPMSMHIQHTDEDIHLYSFPEKSEKRNQLEPRTLDPTHLLTNLRTHMCKKGFTFFDNKSLLKICDEEPKILPRSLVVDIVDQQNVDFAKRVFCKEVQNELMKNGDVCEAYFVKLVREWYEACDERGITAEKRVNRLLNMYKFLIEGVNFEDFPQVGTHVKGIPLVTYEGILQSICTRLILYAICWRRTYNHRSISTLGIENFYSLLTQSDPTSTGCPKAKQIHIILPHIIEKHFHQSNPNKIFAMDKRSNAPYPYSTMDKVVESDTDDESIGVQFKNHNFDKFIKPTQKRKKIRVGIGGIHDTERGKKTIRSDYYKLDESKLTTLQKLGIPENVDIDL